MVKMKQNIFRKTAVGAAISMALMASPIVQAFELKKLELEGSNRIGLSTITSYLPFAVGDNLTVESTQQAIQALYKTGFFTDVSLFDKGDGTLVIKVVERPSIATVKIEGNKLIETEVLTNALESLGIKQGRIYNQLDLDRIIIDLKRRYQNQGYYAAKIEIESTTLERNRVDLTIKIIEGSAATLGRITLVGNEVYSDKLLQSKLSLEAAVESDAGDNYSKPEVEADIERLRTFYMDTGYADFQVRSSQVSLSVDKTKVYATINIEEGEQSHFATIDFNGETILSEEELQQMTPFKTGDVFSRSQVMQTINAIRDRLSEEGYAFAEVEPETILNRENNTIDLNIQIDPKSRVYIRRVLIDGNTRTRDSVIRREMRQFESAPYSLSKVRQSKARLQRLGFFKATDIETKRVSPDQVDLIVKVEEQPTGSFTAGVGYSQLDGVSFNIGLSERNFIGSGNKLDLSVNTSSARKSADIGVTNPYFTEDGVSLGVGFYYSELDAEELDVADYTTNNLGIRVNSGYPLSEDARINYGLKFDSQDLVCSSTFIFCQEYTQENDTNTTSIQASIGWSYNTTDSFYFPSKGHKASVSLEAVVPGTSDVPFYKVYLNENYFYPVSKNVSLQLKGGLAFGGGYGDNPQSSLPFYESFYAGGIGTVRGFEPNSLGEYFDINTDGSDRPKGGSARITTTAAFVMPIPFIEDSSNQRISFFLDSGYVYDDIGDVELSSLRSAAGVGFAWITPVGPLTFSLATPVKSEDDDRTQSFQFTLGSSF